jgi:hypothetical protein
MLGFAPSLPLGAWRIATLVTVATPPERVAGPPAGDGRSDARRRGPAAESRRGRALGEERDGAA